MSNPSDIAIRVAGLSKVYHIGVRQRRHNTLRDILADGLTAPFRRIAALFNRQSATRNPQSNDTIWALKDVSLEVKRGEVVGIIGRNGAGKTTLLKILSRITEPTEGRVEIRGRVSSLLEVGTGFHPELTGQENIYLNGAILGMTKAEIKRKFDEIVAFAEVEKFIDTPVKHYSSGMYVRLAFAVAAHLEPEILLVDEVLAVGDVEFQKKCLGKMEHVAREGRTILFVSHNMVAIRTLCKRCLLLGEGGLKGDGDAATVIGEYLGRATCSIFERNESSKDGRPTIRRAWLENGHGDVTLQFSNGEPIFLIAETENPDRIPIELEVSFFDNVYRPLWNFTRAMYGMPAIPSKKVVRCRFAFRPPRLTVPELFIDMAIRPKGDGTFCDHVMGGLRCSILEEAGETSPTRFPNWPILCEMNLTYEVLQD